MLVLEDLHANIETGIYTDKKRKMFMRMLKKGHICK